MIVVDFAVDVSTHWLDWNKFLAFMVFNLIDEMRWLNVNIFPLTALYRLIVKPEQWSNLSHENN